MFVLDVSLVLGSPKTYIMIQHSLLVNLSPIVDPNVTCIGDGIVIVNIPVARFDSSSDVVNSQSVWDEPLCKC